MDDQCDDDCWDEESGWDKEEGGRWKGLGLPLYSSYSWKWRLLFLSNINISFWFNHKKWFMDFNLDSYYLLQKQWAMDEEERDDDEEKRIKKVKIKLNRLLLCKKKRLSIVSIEIGSNKNNEC